MASKNFITKLGSGNFAQLELRCTSTTNVANNTSTITAILYGRTLISGSINIGSRSTTHTVDGGNAKTYTSKDFIRSSAGLVELGRTTHVVNHNSDGKKTVTMNARYPAESTVQGVYHGTVNVGGSFVLDNIPRGMVYVGDANGTVRRGQVWVGDNSGTPRKAIGVWVGDANGTPRRSK